MFLYIMIGIIGVLVGLLLGSLATENRLLRQRVSWYEKLSEEDERDAPKH